MTHPANHHPDRLRTADPTDRADAGAGAALVTGVGGSLAFGALGLLLSIPLLRRLHRRFRTWKAPAIAVVAFATMFSLSAFVIGPAISGDDAPPAPAPGQDVSPDDHVQHHD